MSEQFNYRSVLAPYMRLLLEVKASAGINAQRMKWILKEFDDYALLEHLADPHVTQEFIAGWRKTRVADCDHLCQVLCMASVDHTYVKKGLSVLHTQIARES